MSEDNYNIDNVETHLDGVLWYDEEPVYIVKLVKKYGVRTVFVYNYSVNDYKTFKVVRPDWVPTDASSGEMIAKESLFAKGHNKKVKRKTVNVEKPPIYSAPVIEGTSTITGKIVEGFYERVRKGVGANSQMVPSGAFIGIEDITWDNEGSLNLEELMKEVSRASTEALYERYGLNNHEDGIYF